MTSPTRDAINPYQSPTVSDPQSIPPGEVVLGEYKPQIWPRDMIDVVVGLGFGIVFALFIYGIPLAIAIVLKLPVIAVVNVIVIMICAFAVMLSGIKSISISEHAIRVRRYVRREAVLEWTQVVSIREVNRWEAIIASLVKPHRMCPQCFTSSLYFRIDTRDTYFLFPPQDAATFRTTVEEMWRRSASSGNNHAIG